jgi:hypothetical protein
MTDITLQKAAESARRGRGRPFAKGQSGNPGGRPRGSTNRATRAAELLLDGEATALTRNRCEPSRVSGHRRCARGFRAGR